MQKKAICPCMPGQGSRWGFVSSSAKQSLVFINENQWFFFLIFLAARNFHKPVPVFWLGSVTSEYTSTVVWFFDFQNSRAVNNLFTLHYLALALKAWNNLPAPIFRAIVSRLVDDDEKGAWILLSLLRKGTYLMCSWCSANSLLPSYSE